MTLEVLLPRTLPELQPIKRDEGGLCLGAGVTKLMREGECLKAA